MKKEENVKETVKQKEVGIYSLSLQALPEMWTFQILAELILVLPVLLLRRMINWVAGFGGGVITTANIKSFIFSWRFPVIIVLGALLVLVFLVFELLSQIYLTDNILNGRRAGVFLCIKSGIKSLKRFMNPAGFKIILFIFIAVPLCGIGFSISLTESFYIPNFIMEVVLKQPLLSALYTAVIVGFICYIYRSMFVLHAVLLDGMSPKEGLKYSADIVKKNKASILKRTILNALVVLVVFAISGFILYNISEWILGGFGNDLPKNYRVDALNIIATGATLSEMDVAVVVYRIYAAFAVLVKNYLMSVVVLLTGAYLMLDFNRLYLTCTGRDRDLWPERPKKARYIWKIVLVLSVFVVLGVLSAGLGIFYNSIFTREEPVKLVAHRAGGTMASENSIEGLEKAIEHKCYACEIDVQRTKDGFYIINHDNDFARLTGVAKAPGEMTMDEIRELRIKDTTGNGQELPVVTFEEMLDVIKGRVKLFVELKGPSADEQMVDDVVRIIREHDCVEDTALISLKYNIIDYAESKYPEFETGTLFFASLGDISRLNCDILIMEEETASEGNILSAHEAEKQAIVWTVNTKEGMYHFLDSDIDAVITDEILLAEEVQAQLDDRTDLQVLEDNFKK